MSPASVVPEKPAPSHFVCSPLGMLAALRQKQGKAGMDFTVPSECQSPRPLTHQSGGANDDGSMMAPGHQAFVWASRQSWPEWPKGLGEGGCWDPGWGGISVEIYHPSLSLLSDGGGGRECSLRPWISASPWGQRKKRSP